MLTVGQSFPEFHCQACTGNTPDDLTQIHSGTYEGRWKLFIFYPKDFTFVCPTELVEFGNAASEFNDRNVALLGGSTDNEYAHLAWRLQDKGLSTLPYPLLAAQKLAGDLGILCPENHICLRATYLVDPDGIIQWASANSLPVGRSVAEAIRVIDAVQTGELCACNWNPGDDHL